MGPAMLIAFMPALDAAVLKIAAICEGLRKWSEVAR